MSSWVATIQQSMMLFTDVNARLSESTVKINTCQACGRHSLASSNGRAGRHMESSRPASSQDLFGVPTQAVGISGSLANLAFQPGPVHREAEA